MFSEISSAETSETRFTDFINIYITPVCWILFCLSPVNCILGCATEFVLLVTRKLHGQRHSACHGSSHLRAPTILILLYPYIFVKVCGYSLILGNSLISSQSHRTLNLYFLSLEKFGFLLIAFYLYFLSLEKFGFLLIA